MTAVWLRYERNETTVTQRFLALSTPRTSDVERKSGRTLRHVDFAHRLSDRETWTITIGANELYVPANRTFVETFWKADRVWINFDPQIDEEELDDADWIECTPPSGACPLEYIEGDESLPSIAIPLVQRKPNP